jgi:hypothetical protein
MVNLVDNRNVEIADLERTGESDDARQRPLTLSRRGRQLRPVRPPA